MCGQGRESVCDSLCSGEVAIFLSPGNCQLLDSRQEERLLKGIFQEIPFLEVSPQKINF
jgi:hypothetical protein